MHGGSERFDLAIYTPCKEDYSEPRPTGEEEEEVFSFLGKRIGNTK